MFDYVMVYRVIGDKPKFEVYLQLFKADVQKDNILFRIPLRDRSLDCMAHELNNCFLSPNKYYPNSIKRNFKEEK